MLQELLPKVEHQRRAPHLMSGLADMRRHVWPVPPGRPPGKQGCLTIALLSSHSPLSPYSSMRPPSAHTECQARGSGTSPFCSTSDQRLVLRHVGCGLCELWGFAGVVQGVAGRPCSTSNRRSVLRWVGEGLKFDACRPLCFGQTRRWCCRHACTLFDPGTLHAANSSPEVEHVQVVEHAPAGA